jgi:hypothetical protein
LSNPGAPQAGSDQVMTVAETAVREAAQDFVPDIIRADILPMGCPGQTAKTGQGLWKSLNSI